MKFKIKMLFVVVTLLAACSFALAADLTEVQEKIRDKANIEQLQMREDGDKIILEGAAATLKDKYEAEKIVKKELKKDVENKIEVSGAIQRTDEEITIDVVDRIRKEATTSGIFDNLEVITKGGMVTIRGKVRNAHLYDVAQEAAMEVSGVRQVSNQIEILPPSQNDDRLRLQIYRRLRNDDRLFYYFLGARPSISIIVDRGRATLTGYVDTEGDRILAGSLVRQVPGILSVENQLRVD
jgi:osmotically-inducible protein OsmY